MWLAREVLIQALCQAGAKRAGRFYYRDASKLVLQDRSPARPVYSETTQSLRLMIHSRCPIAVTRARSLQYAGSINLRRATAKPTFISHARNAIPVCRRFFSSSHHLLSEDREKLLSNFKATCAGHEPTV